MKPYSAKDCQRLAAHIKEHGTSEGFVPTPRAPRKNEEFKMQCELISWWSGYCKTVGVPEFLLWHTPNSAVYGGSKQQREKMGAMLKRLGQRSGVSDLFLAVPRLISGHSKTLPSGWLETSFPETHHGLFLELKAAKGVVSAEQNAILEELQHRGYATAICRTLDDAKTTIINYLHG